MNLYKLIQGDCLQVFPTIEDNSIDFIITSPPYNIKKDYDEYADDLSYDDYLVWLDLVWDECYRVLRDGARICININDLGRNPYHPTHCDVASRMRKKWFLMGIIVWDKTNCLSNTAWGSWMKTSAPGLRGMHEYIIVAGKGGKFFRKDVEDDKWAKKEFLRSTLEIWRFPPETRKRDHPAPFPLELPKRAIKLFSYPNDVVLDPFIGSGTTIEACQDLGRSCVGIELSEKYCASIKQKFFGRQFLNRTVGYEFSEFNKKGDKDE